MITLNQEQQEATNVRKGFYSILAGPGSGKTQVITQRYQDLLAEGEDPEQIISLTFSNEASKNMSKRAGVGKEPTSRPSGFRTFHSFALSFVSSERFLFPFPVASFPLAVDSSLYAIQAIRAHKVNYKEFITWLSRTKRNRISPEKALEQASTSKEKDMARAYKMYEDTCHSNGVLDFDSMLIETVNLLEKNERVRMRWQYKWLQIDEAQDADGIQWRLVQLLSEAYQNVFAVGDGNQCIYEWRSAHPDLFLNFKELFPGSKELYLGENFRSTPQITAYVKRNAPIQNGLLDRMLSNRPNGPEPFVRKFGGEYDEAFSICEDISLHDKEYVLGNNIAILSRTNQGLRAYQDFLGAKGVKYFLLGKSGFWQQKEVKKIVDAMRLLSPSFGDMPADTIADKAISDLGIMRYAENFAETDNSPLDNIRELRVVASRFKTLNGFLDHAAKMQKLSRVKKGVALSTIHASKGKEWKEVYVIQCSEGTIPHKNGDLDEEHRTFFVAKSRAADILRISYSGTPSRFLA